MNKMTVENESLFSPINHKLVWLAGITAGLIVLYIRVFSPPYTGHWSGYSVTSMLVESAVFWIITSRMFTEYRKAALNTMYVSLGIVLIQYYVNKNLSYQVNYYLEIINFILAIIPAILFFYMAGKITQKSLIVALAIAALSTSPVIETAFTNMFSLFFRINNFCTILYKVIIAMFMPMAFIFIKVEILKQALLFPNKEFKDTSLNLNQEYPKLQYMVLYFATRIALDITALRFIRVIASGNFENNGSNPMNYFPVLIVWMITLYLVAWFHRKYLIEYLLTYNKVPSFLYWGLMIPFINLIIFLISYIFMNNRIDVESRKANLKHASSMNYYEYIGYTILLLQGFSLFLSVAKLDWMHILTGSVSFFSFIYFIKGKNIAFYILAGFNLALLFILSLPVNLAKDTDSDLYVSLPLILVAIYLMYGIFYIDKFSAEENPEGIEDKTFKTQEL